MSQRHHISPPKLAQKLLQWFIKDELLEEILGDLEEKYDLELEAYSTSKANRHYWYQVIQYIRPFAIKRSRLIQSNWTVMFNHYLKVSWRNILRSKGFSFINVFGLAFGLTTSVLIMMYVVDEWSYDKHHDGGERIYRIASQSDADKWVAIPAPVGGAVKESLPEVETATRLVRIPGFETILLKGKEAEKQFFETNVFYADRTFFDVFTYDFLYGGADALSKPNTIVISEDVATKFFGDANPVGEALTIGLSFGDFTYTITGVFDRDRYKSHIPANVLLSMNNNDIGAWVKQQQSWVYNGLFHTYVKVKSGTDPEQFENKVDELYQAEAGEILVQAGFTKSLFLQPMEDIYLHSNYGYEVAPNGNMTYLIIFSSIALFLVVIACVNFMNLSTAKSEQRAKEVGLRKVIGAFRSSLVGQFMMESLLMSGLALIITLIILQLVTPYFNGLISRELSIWSMPVVLGLLVVLTFASGIVSGLYPSFYLSSFGPAAALKGSLKNSYSAKTIRKGLVVFQFTISSILILGVLLINQQMQYMSSQELGFDRHHKLIMPLKTGEAVQNSELLKSKLRNTSEVQQVTVGGVYPGIESVTDMLFFAEGKTSQENVDIQTAYAEDNYIETLGIELLKGRTFSTEFKSDTNAVVLNESAIQSLGYDTETAVGKQVYYALDGKRHAMRIIGIVADYHFQSLQHEIEPLALLNSPFFSGPTRYIIMDVQTSSYPFLIQSVKKIWDEVNPGSPFQYSFLDADFERNYRKEMLTMKLIQSFTLVAIVIACLGLFGLVTFTAERRTKEIGVRKVLGASVGQMVVLLSSEFAKLVLIAVLIAAPIAYWIMEEWLNEFAYRIDMSWWVFVFAGLIAMSMALLTVSFQAAKAALSNPVNSLRSE